MDEWKNCGMIRRQIAVVEMVVLLLLTWAAAAAKAATAAHNEHMPLHPPRKEGRFLRGRPSRAQVELRLESSRFLSTNDEEKEEGNPTEGLDSSALEAFHKDISSEQYTREGDLIWSQRTLIFLSSSSSSATTSSSLSSSPNSSSAPSSTTPDQGNSLSRFLMPREHWRVSHGDDDRNQDDNGRYQDDDGRYQDDDRYQNDDDTDRRNQTDVSDDIYNWEPPPEIEEDELWLECNQNHDGGGRVPPECEDLISSTTNSGGSSSMGADGNGDDKDSSAVDNLVRMRIVVGMAQRPTNMIFMSHVISLAINQLLRTMTPFQAFYFGEESIQQQLQQDHQRSLEHQRTQHSPSDSSAAYLSSYPTIQLLHAWTTMERLPLSMKDHPDIVLYDTRVDYGAFFEAQPDQNPTPIRYSRQLGNITWLGQSYVDRDVENGVLVRQIEQIIQDMLDQALGHQDSTTENATGRNMTTWTNLTYWQEIKDNTDFAYAAHMGEDERPGIPFWTEAWMNQHDLRIVSSDPLTLEFGLREWFGVSIGGITLLLATFLFCTSSWYHRRQLENEWKQVMLTEQGISDVLRVAWRYQTTTTCEDNAPNNLSRKQLFLQIYEKPKVRGDDDSMLPGGVEREEVELSSGNTSQTLKMSESESDSSGGGKRLT